MKKFKVAHKVCDPVDYTIVDMSLNKPPSLTCTNCGKKFHYLTIVGDVDKRYLFGTAGNTKYPAYCKGCYNKWKSWEKLVNLNSKLNPYGN